MDDDENKTFNRAIELLRAWKDQDDNDRKVLGLGTQATNRLYWETEFFLRGK